MTADGIRDWARDEPDPEFTERLRAAMHAELDEAMVRHPERVDISNLVAEMWAHPDIVAMAEPAVKCLDGQGIFRRWHVHPKLGDGVLLYMEGAPRHARPEPSRWSRVVSGLSRLVFGGGA